MGIASSLIGTPSAAEAEALGTGIEIAVETAANELEAVRWLSSSKVRRTMTGRQRPNSLVDAIHVHL
jgi:hypothetical protein